MDRRHFLATGAAAMTPLPVSAQDRWYVPAEEEPHQATFMAWPANLSVYGDRWFMNEVQDTIATIASTIALFEPVILLADPGLHSDIQRRVGADVKLWNIPTDDLWARDSGAIFVKQNNSLAVSGIQFNGWGRKQTHRNDRHVASRIAERLGLKRLPGSLIGEGGSTEQDGHGLLMAHESSWVIRNRNPGLNRVQIEKELLNAYGATQMIWAPGVKGLDITDYHIDSLARFTGPGRVLMNLPDRPDLRDPFHAAALETHDILAARSLDIDVIPEPERPRVRSADFVASYANYYVCNGAVIAAQFGDRDTDKLAEQTLRKHYPGREIVTLNVDRLGELGGGIHCATQQMPA